MNDPDIVALLGTLDREDPVQRTVGRAIIDYDEFDLVDPRLPQG